MDGALTLAGCPAAVTWAKWSADAGNGGGGGVKGRRGSRPLCSVAVAVSSETRHRRLVVVAVAVAVVVAADVLAAALPSVRDSRFTLASAVSACSLLCPASHDNR